MASEDLIEAEGTVVDVNRDSFTVQLIEKPEHRVNAHIGGKLKKFRIKVVLGDRVTVAMSPYDLTRGRITFRHR